MTRSKLLATFVSASLITYLKRVQKILDTYRYIIGNITVTVNDFQ